MRLRAFMTGGALAVAAAAAVAVPAPAAELGLVPAGGAKFPDRAWVLTLPERRDLTRDDVQIRENGKAVIDLQVQPGGKAGRRTFATVLALDASDSMKGAAIRDAVSAARAFVERREPNQPMGLVLFSRESRVALPLTTDPAKIDAALAGTPELSRGTRIFDAGRAAIDLLEDSGISAGSVVVLSDGADEGSATSLQQLSALAKRNNTRVFTVGLRSPAYDPSTLTSIAAATGADHAEAGSRAELRDVYGRLGEQLSSQYLVTYRSLAPAGADVQVSAGIGSLPNAAAATYKAPSLPAPAPAVVSGSDSKGPPLIAALVVAALLALALVLALRGPRKSVATRIGRYVSLSQTRDLFEIAEAPRESRVSAALSAFGERAKWWPRFSEAVRLADIGVTAGQLALATTVVTALTAWGLAAAGRPVAAVLMLTIPIGVRAFVGVRVNRKRRMFADQLADNLLVVASSMRAGHSFESGLAVAAEDAAEPMRGELLQLVKDERLGVPLETAMAGVAERMESREFEQVGHIVVVQREAGGNIAELLDRTVESLRERADLRRMVYSLTSQGRFGGAVVTAMPFLTALFLSLVIPGYFDAMLEHPAGKPLVAIAAAMVVAGWLAIRKLVDIKV